MKNKCFFLFLFSFLLHAGFAQVYNFKNYGTKNGLVGSIVSSIFQDSKGFMWFGAQNGLSRFDGKTFKNFSKADGLVGNDVVTIAEDKQGNIWFGTTEGISRFDGRKFHNYTVKDGLGSNTIRFLFIDSKNALWAATDTAGIAKFENNRFDMSVGPAGLKNKKIYTISEDQHGDYWFGLHRGIARYDGKRLTSYSQHKENNEEIIFSSFRDSQNNLWFGGANGDGVLKYNGKQFEQMKLPAEVKNDFIGSITEDKNHHMWFATDHGVLEYDRKKFTLFTEENGLAANQVQSVYTDLENNVWIGTLSGGVDVLKNPSFASYTKKEGLATNRINALYSNAANELYVGTDLGINRFDGHSFSTNKFIKELTGAKILSIAQNEAGELWVGVENKGVYVLEKSGDSFVAKRHVQKIAGQSELLAVVKILFDSRGNTWLGDYGSGLVCIAKDETIKAYNTKNGLLSDNIITLFEDAGKNIWIGSEGGVLRFKDNIFKAYTTENGLASKAVWAIAEDDKHSMYFGTQEGGISCFDGNTFKTLSTRDNLCSNYVEALLWDDAEKSLWAGTDKGINQIKLKQNFELESIQYFGEKEGFTGIEVNNNAIYKDQAGLIWFGTINGLWCYNHHFAYLNNHAPRLIFNEILLDLQTADWKKFADSIESNNIPENLKLPYNKNHLTFNFQALTTDAVKYSYMLEGQDAGWSPYSYSTEANYTNISPGNTYTFKVRAISTLGVVSEKNLEFSFAIRSPWWKTWWFYTLAILFSFVAVYAFVIYRTTKLAAEKLKLENTVQERTKELSESNKNITDSINYAKRIQTAILPSMKLIGDYFDNFFILYKPKDIVAGDFYWMEATDDLVLFAVCDCTGHGVPGAMVSVVCHNALNRAVREFGLREPNEILDKTTEIVIENFSKSEVEIKDGMDISLCAYNIRTRQLSWAGANAPLWILRNTELTEVKANKQPIAWNDRRNAFTNHSFSLQSGDKIFMFSDGFADQFGGEKLKKLTRKRFRELLLSIQGLSMTEQEASLDRFLTEYRRDLEQTDDILVMGVQL
jgi:ligand-binding sensor domain-containing protein/serine phosphatase RsbU (regulator of sigma subunit)